MEQLSEADIPDQDENLPDKQVVTEADAYIKACTIVLKSFVEIYDENMPEEVEQLILDLCGEAMLGFPTRESMQDAVARLGLDYLCSGASNRLGVSVQLVRPHKQYLMLFSQCFAYEGSVFESRFLVCCGKFYILMPRQLMQSG